MKLVNRRGNLVWVAFMVFVGLVFIGNGALEAVMLLLGSVLLAAMWLVGKRFSLPTRQTQTKVEVSQVARAARLQASHRPDYDTYYTLADLGLIVDEQRHDGMKLRRVHSASLDDRALRPYIVVQAPQYGHPTQTLLRFEITDARGTPQFIYEMEHYMRAGENAILPNYRLPLRGNDKLGQTGKWDLQVWINGGLLAVHTFSLNPSYEERQRAFGGDGELKVATPSLREDPVPLSLDEIIAQQHQASSH